MSWRAVTDSTKPVTGLRGANAIFATLSAGSAVLLLLLQGFMTQRLGEEVFGRFQWILTLSMLGEALMDFGVHQLMIRSIARDRSQTPRLFHNALALKAATGAAMFATLAGVAFALAADADLWMASLVMLGVAILRSYLLTIRGVFQGLERFGYDCLVVVGDRVLVVILAALAIYEGYGLLGVALAFIAARLIAFGLALLLVSRHSGGVRVDFDFALWHELQRQALPIGMFLVVLNFYSYIDTLMLGVMSTFVDTGLYGIAYRLYEGLSYVPAILSALLTPRLANLWSVDRARHVRLARASLAGAAGLAIVTAAPVWVLSRPLLVFVFGPAAEESTTALHILLAGLAFVFTIWILHAVALSVFKERLLLTTTAVGAIVNAGLNVFLIPRYGRNGAAAATLLGELLTMSLLFWGLRAALWPAREHVR
jgi:O-antigen/teichoic acid export membrane protein